jgi:anti-anti-sigma factor
MIKIRRSPDFVHVTLTGEIDIAAATPLCGRLSVLAADGGLVVADLDQLSFIDAAGLGALAKVARQATVHGGRLGVVCNGRQTRLLFRLTGLDRTVRVARTLAEALRPVAAVGSVTAIEPVTVVEPVTAGLETQACET